MVMLNGDTQDENEDKKVQDDSSKNDETEKNKVDEASSAEVKKIEANEEKVPET